MQLKPPYVGGFFVCVHNLLLEQCQVSDIDHLTFMVNFINAIKIYI